ncbi:MAG TPA: serine hydrolase domain-containing protein [Vitreimonas sp.]|uniref:serine hydrolase domain-containing protein n=1 Tax=Vitreimonas sp. TaxID=3069702 RepID=UPI002D508805|nr:serine hydrolase domain-containing protein [Vitreimonas sp.]HYD86917.1 serine hydrolase domain-containing protein [Vitreimonas sp.]
MSARILFALAIVLVAGCTSAGSSGRARLAEDRPVVAGELGRSIDAVASRYADYGYQFSLLVAQGDAIVLQRAYGPGLTTATVFNAASIGKQFTATAIVKLASEGRLQLSQPLTDFFPEAPAGFGAITIDHLLSHTSGLRDNYDFPEGFATSAELKRYLFSQTLASAPGEEWSYCNFCYSLLALVVERASGREFKDYLRTELFERAGLENTGFRGDTRWSIDQRPMSIGGTHVEYPRVDTWGFGLGGGGVVTSPGDLFRWVQALREGRIVPEQWRARLDEPLKDVFAGLSYGRGWWTRHVVIEGQDHLNIWHSGQEEVGFSAWLNRYPTDGVVTIFQTNQAIEGAPLREAFNSAGGPSVLERLIFGGGDVSLPPPVIEIQDLEPFVGTYRVDVANWIEVRANAPFLEIIPHGQAAFDALLPSGVGARAPTILAAATAHTQEIFSELAVGRRAALERYRPSTEPISTELTPFDAFEVLGSTALEPIRDSGSGSVVTFVRVRKDGRDLLWRIHWNEGEAGAVYESAAPILPAFRAIGAREFANFQPFIRGSAFVRFSESVALLGSVQAHRSN